MKNKIIITLVLTTILTACSSSKKTISNKTEVEFGQMTTTDIDSKKIQEDTVKQVNGSTGAINNSMTQNSSKILGTDDLEMFNKLNMSDNQISTFTNAMNRFKTKQANTASGEMLGSLDSERNRQMESILSTSQYAKYEQWVADNE
ncbi:hypothetical protein [Maribacter sp. Asnod1-A12]|uniref:hypothetical protein n=1 Tax=Maribacter sp. Asnod1-A12 TaxID=3160576 RepID=UPI003866E019